MSVINEMLKDLENRSKPVLEHESIFSGIKTRYVSTDQVKKRKTRWIAAIFIFFGILFVYYQYYFSVSKNELIQFSNPLLENSASIKSFSPFKAAELTAISLQSEADETHLRFLLNNPIMYRVATDKEKILIYLENTKLETSLPIIDSINSAIKDIKIIPLKNDLKIILVLKENVELTHLELNKFAERPELLIDFFDANYLKRETPVVRVAKTESSPIKKQTSVIEKIARFNAQLENDYQLALRHSSAGLKTEAITELQTILEKDPDFFPGREALVNLLISEGRLDDAVTILELGLRTHPSYLPFIELKAKILLTADKVTQALQTLLQIKPNIVENPNYYAFVAALYERQGNSTNAKNIYEKLLSIQPNNSTWWVGLGISLEHLNQKNAALRAYAKANSPDLSNELKSFLESRLNN